MAGTIKIHRAQITEVPLEAAEIEDILEIMHRVIVTHDIAHDRLEGKEKLAVYEAAFDLFLVAHDRLTKALPLELFL
jgi:hypothetical protein